MRGIADKTKCKAIFEVHRKNSDILILQETHSMKEFETLWELEWGGDTIFCHGTSASRGIVVLLPKGMKKCISKIYTDNDGRLIIFDITEKDTVITFIALYAPNQDTPRFYNLIREQISERSEHKIMLGDFNLTLDVDLDRKNTYNNNNKSLNVLQDMMDEFCLVDVWRLQNEETREYSWFRSGNLNQASRLDFALVSAGLDHKVKAVQYLPSIMSDHRPIYVCVDIDHNERGSGYWKFNNTFLLRKEFLDIMNNEIDTTLQLCINKKPTITWEILKSRITKKTIEYSKTSTSQ